MLGRMALATHLTKEQTMSEQIRLPTIPLITQVVVQPNPRIWELFRKDGPLTDDEWAELELYEAMQKEDFDEG